MTDRRRFHRSLRLATAGLTLFAICAACTYSEGERAETGACPEGETCSDATPAGLQFYGALPGDDDGGLDWIRAVAMGGTQRLAIVAPEGVALDVADVRSSAPWFLTIAPDAEPAVGEVGVELSGLAEGDAYVRVLDANGDLHDRVLMRVARVATVDATANGAGDAIAGARNSVVFRLVSAQGDRLVDEGMTIESDDVDVERISWDCIDFTAPSAQGEVTFRLEAGHRRWAITVPVR